MAAQTRHTKLLETLKRRTVMPRLTKTILHFRKITGDGCGCIAQAGMSEELEWELYDIFESGLFAFPIWDHNSARKIVNYLLGRGVLNEEIADAIEDSTYDLDIWLNRGGKHMVGEWIIAWVNECREEYDAEKLQEQIEMEEGYLRGTPQSSDHSDSDDDDYGSDSEVRQLTEVEDVDYEDHLPKAGGETSTCDKTEGDQLGDGEGAVGLPPRPAKVSWGSRAEEMESQDQIDDDDNDDDDDDDHGAKSDSEDDDDRNDHPPKNVMHGVVTNGEDKRKSKIKSESESETRSESESKIFTQSESETRSENGSRIKSESESASEKSLTVTVSGATSSFAPIPDLRGSLRCLMDTNISSNAKHFKPRLIPIQCSIVPPPGSPGFISHLEKTGLPICPNCTCKLAHSSVDANDNNCIDMYLTHTPAMEITINTLDKDGPGFIFILTDCLTQCLPWNTACRYKVTSSRQPERHIKQFSQKNIDIEIIWQIRVQHHILAVNEVHTYLQTFNMHTNWYKCPLKVIVETVSKVAKRFREA